MHLRSSTPLSPRSNSSHLLSIFFFLIRLFLFFLLPPLLFPYVISRFYYDFIIEGRKKIRGGIDSRKELERKNIGARMLYLLALSRCYAIPGLR